MEQYTPLREAVINRRYAVTKLLLDKGADIDATSRNNETAFIFCLFQIMILK